MLAEVKFQLVHQDRGYEFQPEAAIYNDNDSETQGILTYRVEAAFRITSEAPPGIYELKNVHVRTAGGQLAPFGPGEMLALGEGRRPSFVVEEEMDKDSIKVSTPEFILYS